MTKKKEKHINELTRKQLITKCRGRGIRIGHLLREIDHRIEWGKEKIEQIGELRKQNKELIDQCFMWKNRALDHESDAIEEHTKRKTLEQVLEGQQIATEELRTKLEDATTTIATCDAVIANADKEVISLRKQIEEHSLELTALKDEYAGYKQVAERMINNYSIALRSCHDVSKISLESVVPIPQIVKED